MKIKTNKCEIVKYKVVKYKITIKSDNKYKKTKC